MNLKDLEGKEIVIYGAGHVGQKFYRTLRMYGMEKQVICFAVTGQAGEEAWAEGVPVKCIHDIFIGAIHWSVWQFTRLCGMRWQVSSDRSRDSIYGFILICMI